MNKLYIGIIKLLKFSEKSFANYLEIGMVLLLAIFMFYSWATYPEKLIAMDKALSNIHSQELKKEEAKTYLQTIGDKYGTYGDSYGSLNALFSGVASFLLLISLILQRQELQAQRKELAAQREEISKANDIAEQQMLITEQQADLLGKQIQEAQVQNFFNILFPLINRKNNYYEIANKFPEGFTPDSTSKQNGVFKTIQIGTAKIYRNFDKTYKNDYLNSDEIKKILKEMKAIQSPLITACSFIIYSSYFKHFNYIINFIEKFKGIDENDKSIALSIFISDFSTIELMTISIIALDDDILLEKIKKYKLLKSLFRLHEDEPTLLSSFFND
ncbi:hypothetical protein QDR25_13955 [Acinetobacter baumannii]|uniref:hypothetical protein n=1 Tax=Acinetobacter baumannii TaxID=470 RepID=UPI00233F4251|nr:hypothetical protein [Acinetobacter baumannii]MDC5292256.1 hypothetical protein [Acinetobacter baumannii]MDH2482152.1 hypothetical protein [Acinetobacter baumannii]MDH2503216.1 hypothetical protein [Acinetobacter baumannii]MDO7483876.1 hypothetical protein [Acinetobacter baumannii]MDV7466112.1 hypothetical protein [Acinetobacter baumannii]